MKGFVWLAPRICWGLLLILLIVWTFLTKGRSANGEENLQRFLNLHYLFMTIAW